MRLPRKFEKKKKKENTKNRNFWQAAHIQPLLSIMKSLKKKLTFKSGSHLRFERDSKWWLVTTALKWIFFLLFQYITPFQRWQFLEPTISSPSRDRHTCPLTFLYQIESLTTFIWSISWCNVFLFLFFFFGRVRPQHDSTLLFSYILIFRKW